MEALIETPTRPALVTSDKSKALEATLLPIMQLLDGNVEFPDHLRALPGVIDQKTIRSKPAGKPVVRLNYVEILDEQGDTLTVLFDSSDGKRDTVQVLAMPLKEVSWRYDYDAQKLV